MNTHSTHGKTQSSTHSISCQDLGNPVCDYIATGDSDAEVKRKMLDHASKAHPENVKTAAEKDALGRKIDEVLDAKRESGGIRAEGDLEPHGARGRYGVEEEAEDESQGGEFLEGESSRKDADARRRNADRDAEMKRTGEDLR